MQIGDIVAALVPVDVVAIAAVGTTSGGIQKLFAKRHGHHHRFAGNAKQLAPGRIFFGGGHVLQGIGAHHQIKRSLGKRQCLGIAQDAVEWQARERFGA